MSHYGYDAQGWYTGPVEDDAPASTPIAPDITNTSTAPGELRSRWYRYVWTSEPYAVPSVPVPAFVTRRQAREVLLDADLLDAVEAAIDAMPGKEGRRARIQWQDAAEVHRDWPLVLALGAALGLTDTQMDDLFRAAAQL